METWIVRLCLHLGDDREEQLTVYCDNAHQSGEKQNKLPEVTSLCQKTLWKGTLCHKQVSWGSQVTR
ncbi:hypothetical protein GN956_G24022 [Arapaima gigas]